MIRSNTERFISRFNDNKFERKNRISKICGMRKLQYLLVIFFILLALPAILNAQREITVAGDVIYVKVGDGLNGMLMPRTDASNVDVAFYFQSGSMYESDSVSGTSNLLVKIIGDKIISSLKNDRNQLSNQNTKFSYYVNTEYAVLKFTTTSQNIPACLKLIRDSIFSGRIYQPELNKARTSILQQIEEEKHDLKKIFETRLLNGLYVQDHQKFETLGNSTEIKTFDLNTLTIALKKYYVPNNTIVLVTGNFQAGNVEDALETTYKDVLKGEFNPETITKIVDLRPMAYNTQFIIEDTTNNPEFQICWQFPGTNNNPHDSYCAFLINALLNDKNNYIQVKAAKLGCKKLTVQYEANNFNGILRVSFQPSKQNLYTTYQFIITELGRLNKTLLNDVMIGAAKIKFKKEYEELKKSKEYPTWVANHWTYDNNTFLPELLDSVMPLGMPRIERFVNDYIIGSPHITGLRISKADRSALKIDSLFTDIDQTVAQYIFTYRQNVTSLEGDDNQLKLRNLLQWLNINTDVNVQVNGFSDEHEYRRATDEDSIIQFMDSMPTFHMVTSDFIKHKFYVTPELARSAKIVRYLYEHGIAAERINGTSMMFKSGNKQEEADNMKCNLTLNKVHKSPSLYEYHYGKKKGQ